jgi:hypothetical protein
MVAAQNIQFIVLMAAPGTGLTIINPAKLFSWKISWNE